MAESLPPIKRRYWRVHKTNVEDVNNLYNYI